MYQIDVDFEVYKELFNRRASEEVSYNDVIRQLLGLGPTRKPIAGVEAPNTSSAGDWVTKGERFPAGTEFRASYKGKMHYGKVEVGALVVNGRRYNSPSAAANFVTFTNVNGWRFWEARRPGETGWARLDSLRRRRRHLTAESINALLD